MVKLCVKERGERERSTKEKEKSRSPVWRNINMTTQYACVVHVGLQ